MRDCCAIERRVVQLILAFLAGAAVVVLIATIAGLWNGTSTRVILNTETVERSIENSIQTQRHLASTVSCPDNVAQKAGVVFYCYATVKQARFPVMVTETDGNGHVTYVVT